MNTIIFAIMNVLLVPIVYFVIQLNVMKLQKNALIHYQKVIIWIQKKKIIKNALKNANHVLDQEMQRIIIAVNANKA